MAKKSIFSVKIAVSEKATHKIVVLFLIIAFIALTLLSLLSFFGVLLFCQNTETSNYSVKIICCTVLAGLAMILITIVVCIVINALKKRLTACEDKRNCDMCHKALFDAYKQIFSKKTDSTDRSNNGGSDKKE